MKAGGAEPRADYHGPMFATPHNRHMLLLTLALVISLVTAGVALYGIHDVRGRSAPLPPPATNASLFSDLTVDYFHAPYFAFTTQYGKPFTRDDLNGKVWIAEFFFTRCPLLCKIISSEMENVQAALSEHPQWDEVRLVGFSLDPEHDTPEVLAAYAAQHRADPDHWLMLTGDPERMREVVTQGFKFGLDRTEAKTEGGGPIIAHTPMLVLIDRTGRIRGLYPATRKEAVAALIVDTKRLLEGTAPTVVPEASP